MKQVNSSSDWGLDMTWCLAAEEYAAETHDVQRTACGMITTPVDHTDTDSSGWQRSTKAQKEFRKVGFEVLKWTRANYGSWNYEYPPRATLLIPALPPDDPEAGLPWPYWVKNS